MACINMFNSEHQGLHGAPPPMSPRISFSNDFVVIESSSSANKHSSEAAPPDPNFEFSVGSRPMMAADELFFKGRMLPLRGATTTLRDELRATEDDDRVSTKRWRELLGLRRPHYSKKLDKSDGSSDPDAKSSEVAEI